MKCATGKMSSMDIATRILLFLLVLYITTTRVLLARALRYCAFNDVWKNAHPDEYPRRLVLPTTIDFRTDHLEPSIALACTFMINLVYMKEEGTQEGASSRLPAGVEELWECRDSSRRILTVVYRYKNILWCCSRGTISTQDVLRDATTSQTRPGWPTDDDSTGTSLVHKGFCRSYQDIRDQLLRFAQTYSDDLDTLPLVLSGHSLGAGIAVLMLSDTEMRRSYRITVPRPNVLHNNATAVYLFGCPRVGNADFVRHVYDRISSQSDGVACYRITNTDDIIATTPLPITVRLTAPRSPFFYEHFGTPIVFSWNRCSYDENHSLFTYAEAITTILNQNKF